jgi:hypothetical protein
MASLLGLRCPDFLKRSRGIRGKLSDAVQSRPAFLLAPENAARKASPCRLPFQRELHYFVGNAGAV